MTLTTASALIFAASAATLVARAALMAVMFPRAIAPRVFSATRPAQTAAKKSIQFDQMGGKKVLHKGGQM